MGLSPAKAEPQMTSDIRIENRKNLRIVILLIFDTIFVVYYLLVFQSLNIEKRWGVSNKNDGVLRIKK